MSRLPPVKGLYPTVLLGDGRWERVLKALRLRDTKADDAIANIIERSVQHDRQRYHERHAPPT